MGWQESTPLISLHNQEKLVRGKTEQSKVLVTHFPFHLSINQETAAAVLWGSSKKELFKIPSEWAHMDGMCTFRGTGRTVRKSCYLLGDGALQNTGTQHPGRMGDTGNAVHAFLKSPTGIQQCLKWEGCVPQSGHSHSICSYIEFINFRIWMEGFTLHQWGEGLSEIHK